MIPNRTRSASFSGILLVVGFSSQAPENTMAAYEAAVGAHHFRNVPDVALEQLP